MSDKTVDLTPAAQRLADLVARVRDEELSGPTPCPAYTLGDLIEHIGGLALAFRAAADKDTASPRVGEASPGNVARLGAGWRERIPADLAALAEAWAKPGAWAGMTRIAGQDQPAEIVGIVAADELVVHGWDVARATGQPYSAEPDLLDAAQTFLGFFASPDAPAGPEVAFGPSRPVADGTAPLDRVVALAGRDPAWAAGLTWRTGWLAERSQPPSIRKRCAAAMWSASPIDLVSVRPARVVNSSSRCGSGIRSHIGVRITPGRTALTRSGASSTASPLVRPSMAAAPLAASAAPGAGRTPIVPDVSTIEPPGLIRGAAFLTAAITPRSRPRTAAGPHRVTGPAAAAGPARHRRCKPGGPARRPG